MPAKLNCCWTNNSIGGVVLGTDSSNKTNTEIVIDGNTIVIACIVIACSVTSHKAASCQSSRLDVQQYREHNVSSAAPNVGMGTNLYNRQTAKTQVGRQHNLVTTHCEVSDD